MDRRIERALLSVSDKQGLVELGQYLASRKVEILSTGGTAKALRDAGVPVKDVSEHTGFPEMMDGRVKTLHPKIHGGLLARRENKEDLSALAKQEIGLIDLVIVNLYPFEKTVAKENCPFEEAVENIDIGGPSMLRAAAKNHADVTVVVDPSDYARLKDEMEKNGGGTSREFRYELAVKVFSHTAAYDGAIANYFSAIEKPGAAPSRFPESLNLSFRKLQGLRYGENPHQQGAFYGELSPKEPSLAGAKQLHGKELSYNNILDLHAAFEL
ncbi:MAG: bifunctional phosphoribosylaminoimidazolecarboxamide formyltransferase/IMP cyclohydrolase, partial [Bdellovibrionota bacterium]